MEMKNGSKLINLIHDTQQFTTVVIKICVTQAAFAAVCAMHPVIVQISICNQMFPTCTRTHTHTVLNVDKILACISLAVCAFRSLKWSIQLTDIQNCN